jgi:hypothetical protein
MSSSPMPAALAAIPLQPTRVADVRSLPAVVVGVAHDFPVWWCGAVQLGLSPDVLDELAARKQMCVSAGLLVVRRRQC